MRHALRRGRSEVYLALAGFGRTDLDAEVERISGDAADLRTSGGRDPKLVHRAEEVISIENDGWMARLTGTDNS